MTQRTPWEPGYACGLEPLDRQHQALLAQCDRLAACCEDAAAFDAAFAELKALAQAHFEAEAAALAGDSEDLQDEQDEFGYLLDEVATTANFDRAEVQRFVALWWLGHVRGQAARLQAVQD